MAPAYGGAMTATEQIVGRVNVYQRAPEVFKAMLALNTAARGDLEPTLIELIETRASQINHCASCLDMHARDALAAGVSQRKLFMLDAWAEAGKHYTDREQAALALTEAITLLTDGFVPDEVYRRAESVFDEHELAQLISIAATINAFNRISVASRRAPRPAKAE